MSLCLYNRLELLLIWRPTKSNNFFGVVSNIQLPISNLQGQLPTEIAILSDLKSIEMNANNIPEELVTISLHTFAIEENFI